MKEKLRLFLDSKQVSVWELVTKLICLRPLAESIRSILGSAGVSVGVIHEGEVILTDNFSFRDVEAKIAPDQDTIYYLSSLSKSFTAAGICHLVYKSPLLNWDTPISESVPWLSSEDEAVQQHATILDLLSHRTDLAPKKHLWNHEFGHFTMKRGEDVRIFRYLEKIAEFRGSWLYNNWGYAVADQLIEYIGGTTWGQFLQERIFDPLGMTRTITRKMPDDDNVAKPYVALSNCESYPLEDTDGADGEILAGAIGVRSSVRDLSKYYIAFMQAAKADETKTLSYGTCRPFSEAAKMVQPHVKMNSNSETDDAAYGLGWATTNLPGTLGVIGMNTQRAAVGKGMRNKTACWYHNGSANAYLSCVYLTPETESGVIVLTNSMSLNDAADWIGQLYLETLLDNPEKNDYEQLAKDSVEEAQASWPAMAKELAKKRAPNTSSRPLSKYVGRYYNRIGNYHLTILEKDGMLLLQFQTEVNIAYELKHYHHDTFSWLLSHDSNAKLGRFPIPRATFYILTFCSIGEDGAQIDSLLWAHDDELLHGEKLFKLEGQCAHMIESDPREHPELVRRRESSNIARIASDLHSRVEFLDDGHAKREAAVILTESIEQIEEADAAPERSDTSKL